MVYRQKKNYENLQRRIFPGVGEYGIPQIQPTPPMRAAATSSRSTMPAPAKNGRTKVFISSSTTTSSTGYGTTLTVMLTCSGSFAM